MPLSDIFKPKWKHSNPDVRKAAIEKITDQIILKTVVNSDDNSEVRETAVNRITDQDVLAAVAKKKYESSDVRKAANKRLKALDDIEKAMLESSEKFVVLDKIIPVIKDVNEFSRIVQKKGIPVGLFLVMDDFTLTYGNLQNSVPNPDMGGYNPFYVSAKSGPCLLFCNGCHKLLPDSFIFRQLVLPLARGPGEAFGQKSVNKCPECGNMNAVIIFNPKWKKDY